MAPAEWANPVLHKVTKGQLHSLLEYETSKNIHSFGIEKAAGKLEQCSYRYTGRDSCSCFKSSVNIH